MNLKEQIEKIVKNGAAIVAFDYTKKDGSVSRRNGIVGYTPFGERAWGEHSSRSIVVSKDGEEFLTVKTNNDSGKSAVDGHAYKSFKIKQISNFACKRGA